MAITFERAREVANKIKACDLKLGQSGFLGKRIFYVSSNGKLLEFDSDNGSMWISSGNVEVETLPAGSTITITSGV